MEYVPLVKQVPKTQVREVQKQAGAGAERGERFFLVPSRKQSFLFFLENILLLHVFYLCQVGVPHYQARERVVEAGLALLR